MSNTRYLCLLIANREESRQQYLELTCIVW